MLISSCVELISEKKYPNDYFVVTGVLNSNNPITKDYPIFIGRTISINNYYIKDMVLPDLMVYIFDIESNQRHYLSYYDNISESINTQPYLRIGYYDQNEDLIIRHNQTYRLVVRTGIDSIWAETIVPNEYSVEYSEMFTTNINSIFPSIIYDEIDYLEPIKIFVEDNKEMSFMIEYYCLEEWQNAIWILPDNKNETPKSLQDYENILNAYPRRNIVWHSYKPEPFNDTFLIKLNIDKDDFIFYGNYRIRISLIDENTFNFQNKSSGYYFGGIFNGIGYLGSAAVFDLYTNISLPQKK